VSGLSGTGKSTVAVALHARTGFVHVNSDTTRKQLAGVLPTARPGSSLYTAERSAATYEAMYATARAELAAGRGAILDATFQRRAHRDAARNVARQSGVPVLFAECETPAQEVRRRLAERARANTDASDADWTVYEQQRGNYEPFAADEQKERVAVDTMRPLDTQLARIESKLRAN
jgi:predicted kinase